jgi:hypothetical protein
MTIGAFRLNTLGANLVPITSINPGDGIAPSAATGFVLTFGGASTVSTIATDVFDTSVVYANNDISTGAYAVSYGTTGGQIILNARHNDRILTLTAELAVNGATNAIKRTHNSWGLRASGNFNKRGFTHSQNTSTSRAGSYTLISSNNRSTQSAFTNNPNQLLGEMPVNSSDWHEWIISGNSLAVNRYQGADNASWRSTVNTYTTSLSFIPMYEFYDAVKTSPLNTISFWYGCAQSGIKDMLIIYSASTNTHIVNTSDIFNYADISSSINKKGVLLSANINQTDGINAIGYWDNTAKKLDLRLFTTSVTPSLSASFGNKFTFSMPNETNVRLMTSNIGCNFCYLLSTNAAGTTTYVRKVTATSVNGLTISNAVTFSTLSGTTEMSIGNTATDGMLLYRSGTTSQIVAFTG